MSPAAQPIPHLVAKVRRLDTPQPQPDRAGAWVSLRPFPPGIEPVFMGAIWFWHDGSPEPQAPGLHLLAGQPGPEAPEMRYINLFFDAGLGGSALLDTEAGWRRLDFLFTLPDRHQPLLVRAITQAGAADAGRLAVADGVWRFRPSAAPPPGLGCAPPPPLQPCFIGGAPKSGTTWMQMLLNQHPAVFATGEGVFQRRASMRPYRGNDLWVPPDTPQLALDLFASHATLHTMMQLWHGFTRCGWIADKSPGNAQAYPLLLGYMPDAKLVHCVRHPLDVLISRLHHEASIAAGGSVSHEMRTHAEAVARLPALLAGGLPLRFDAPGWALVLHILGEYALFQAEALEVLRARPGRLLVVRYEDMLDDAQACAARVFAHLGLPADASQAACCAHAVSFANLRARRGGRAHSFFRSGTAGQFMQALAPDDQARAMAHLAARLPDMPAIGYAV